MEEFNNDFFQHFGEQIFAWFFVLVLVGKNNTQWNYNGTIFCINSKKDSWRKENIIWRFVYIVLEIKVNKILQCQIKYSLSRKFFSKDNFEEIIKGAMTWKYKTLIKRKSNLINIDINDDFQKSTVKNHVINDMPQRYDYIAS